MSSQDKLIKAMENWANLYLFRSLSDYFTFLKSTQISMQQAYVLTYIFYNGPSKISEICEYMMVSVAAASQMVDRLENQYLVERVSDPRDGRVRNVVLSEQGEILVEQSVEARQNWIKKIPPELSNDQMDQIASALQKLSAAYQK